MKDEVHIWQAWLADAEPYFDQFVAMLSDEEKMRGERLINPEHRQRFLLAQAIFRNVLSRYTHLPPEMMTFTRNKHGKPYLSGLDLQFNLTHSNECVLIAVTFKNMVGIDVEYINCKHHFDGLVSRFFSQEEQHEYFKCSSNDERRLAFYRGWTRKEAYLKAVGLGLSFPLDQFTVSLAPNDKQALLRVQNDESVRTKWTLFSFNINENYLASLAVKTSVDNLQVQYFSFPYVP